MDITKRTRIYLLEELYYTVADDDTNDELESRCSDSDIKVDDIFMGNQDLIDIYMNAVSQHELRGFALGFEVANKLLKNEKRLSGDKPVMY